MLQKLKEYMYYAKKAVIIYLRLKCKKYYGHTVF